MAIATILTRGYGNGTFTGSIGLVVTRGYLADAQSPSPVDITATGRIDRSVTVIGSIQRTKSITGAVTRSITLTGDTSEAV
jgi:hypothetical protein